MAADLPENYEGNKAFQFIKDVPTDWEKTLVLHAEINEFVTYARKERAGNNWYIGSITNEKSRNLATTLDFLDEGYDYEMTIYADGNGADWDTNPYPVSIKKSYVKKGDSLNIKLAPGGGTAIQIRRI